MSKITLEISKEEYDKMVTEVPRIKVTSDVMENGFTHINIEIDLEPLREKMNKALSDYLLDLDTSEQFKIRDIMFPLRTYVVTNVTEKNFELEKEAENNGKE